MSDWTDFESNKEDKDVTISEQIDSFEGQKARG